MSLLPPCPHLPWPKSGLDWRLLHGFRERDRGTEFYEACLEYAHSLWQRGFAARAILCLDRAFGADLHGHEDEATGWPLPYAAMAWFIAHTPQGTFIGNPRVHFQHFADRVNEPRREQRRWRSWACWAIARKLRPELPGDPRHVVEEPTLEEIATELDRHGWLGESALWRAVMNDCVSLAAAPTKG